MIIPAAPFPNDFTGNQEAGAGNRTAGTQHHTGIVEEFCLTHKPQGITGGNPVGTKILGIAVTGHNPMSLAEGTVHFRKIILIQQIICINNHIGIIIAVAHILCNMLEGIIQCISLANFFGIEPFIHNGTMISGYLCSIIGTIIRNHNGIQQLRWIIL